MAREIRAITMRDSLANMVGQPGPQERAFWWPQDGGAPYVWVPNDAGVPDGWALVGHNDGYPGNWKRLRPLRRGDDLITGAQTIQIGGRPLRVMPVGVMAGNSSVVLGTTNAATGDELTIVSHNLGAWTLTITNGGVGGGTLKIFPSATPARADFWFQDTDWELIGYQLL